MKKIKIGITGAGSFAQSFIPLFKAHPNVTSVALAEVLPERRHDVADEFQIEDTYESHEALCSSDVDAVAIITQRHMHGAQAVEALNKGKHVYSAVPAAITVEEIEELHGCLGGLAFERATGVPGGDSGKDRGAVSGWCGVAFAVARPSRHECQGSARDPR